MTTVDTTGLRQALDEYMRTISEMAAEQLRDDLVQAAPRGENATHGQTSLQETATLEHVVDSDGFQAWRVGFTAEYASYVDEGTGPHEIQGNPLLVFYWQAAGKVVFLRSVQHPGTAATDWFTNGTSPEIWENALNDAAARV
jgi:hypothetical protein